MNRLEGIKQKYDQLSDKHPVVATLGETAVVFALRYGLTKAGERADITLGHGRKNRSYRNQGIDKHLAIAVGAAIALAPVTEELLFREFPSRLIEKRGYDKDTSVSKKVKLGVAAMFAAAHAGPDAIPLPHLIGGLNYSRIHEKRGLRHSILAHVANNSLAAADFALKKRK